MGTSPLSSARAARAKIAERQPRFENDPDSMLSSDQCVIRGQHFFVRGLIEIPVIGSEDFFSWGVWVSLSKDNFTRALEVWNTPGREAEKPYFGWLCTELALYTRPRAGDRHSRGASGVDTSG